MKRFYFLNVFNSPFKRPQFKWYIGKVAIGTPYFLPRKWVKISKEEAHDGTIEQIQKLSGKSWLFFQIFFFTHSKISYFTKLYCCNAKIIII